VSAPLIQRKSRLLALLATVLFVECALLAGVTILLIVELLISRPDSYATAVALIILALLGTVWLGALGLNTLRQRTWVRSGIVVWQILQILIAIASFQGVFAAPLIGSVLLVPAVIALVLVFTGPVTAAIARRPRDGYGDES
jgi:hypothetical protein